MSGKRWDAGPQITQITQKKEVSRRDAPVPSTGATGFRKRGIFVRLDKNRQNNLGQND